jgi:hypothetical protein
MSQCSGRCLVLSAGPETWTPAQHLRLISLVLSLLAVLQAGCRKETGPANDIVVEHLIAPSPPKTGPATITLRLLDSRGVPQAGARISLEGTMTHAGMKPVFSVTREVSPGRYEASLEFTMAGDWIIIIDAALPDGRRIERRVEVKSVEPG